MQFKLQTLDNIICVISIHKCKMCIYLLGSEIHYRGSSASSIRSPLVYEEGMRPGYWIELLLCVSFRALTWLGNRKDICDTKTHFTSPQRFFSRKGAGEGTAFEGIWSSHIFS